jgi:RNA polymerase sigma-70 factor (ECF subfamily)
MAEATRLRAIPGGRSEARPSPTQEEIVLAIARGDDWAADALYDALQPVVERTLRRILQTSEADYEDLLQTAFEKIVTTLATGRFAGACSLSTWASAIAGHVALDALRARVRSRRVFGRDQASLAIALEAPEPINAERRLEARAQIQAVQQALGGMKPDQARTLVLHDVLGHELSEIAVMTGVSVAAAQSRLVRGRKELLRRLGKMPGGAP